MGWGALKSPIIPEIFRGKSATSIVNRVWVVLRLRGLASADPSTRATTEAVLFFRLVWSLNALSRQPKIVRNRFIFLALYFILHESRYKLRPWDVSSGLATYNIVSKTVFGSSRKCLKLQKWGVVLREQKRCTSIIVARVLTPNTPKKTGWCPYRIKRPDQFINPHVRVLLR